MGFLTGILLLPLLPLRGTIWLAEKLTEVAEHEIDSEATFKRLLVEAEIAYEAGELSEAEFEQVEDELLDRLDEARRDQATG